MPKQASELMKEGEDLLSICQKVHMMNTGASDALPDEDLGRYLDVLMLARDHWTPPHPKTTRFDNAVLSLVCATLAEHEDAAM